MKGCNKRTYGCMRSIKSDNNRSGARSVGPTVATAHMADHSLEVEWYALKTIKNASKSIDAVRKWQNEQLPPEIKELVLTARESRKI